MWPLVRDFYNKDVDFPDKITQKETNVANDSLISFLSYEEGFVFFALGEGAELKFVYN